MSPHIPTILLMIIVINLTLAGFLALAARRDIKDGVGTWAVGLALNGVAFFLFAMRGHIPDLLSIVLGNLLMASSLALFAESIGQFQHRVLRRWLIWLPVVLVPVIFYLLMPLQPARVMTGSLIYSCQSAWIVQALFAQRGQIPGKGQYFLMAAFTGLIATLTFQAVGAYHSWHSLTSITAPSTVQVVTYIGVTICSLVIGLGFVLMVKDRTEELNRQLAMHDALTGLLNRRALMDTLHQHMSHSQRSGQPLSLMMVDVDFFKRVNDTYGHLNGDLVLKKLAHILLTRTRAQDVVGRFGGEEFLVVLPDTTLEGGRVLAESIRRAVASESLTLPQGSTVKFTISIGLSQQCSGATPNCDDLIAEADFALYQAKQSGRNLVCVFDPLMADTELPLPDWLRV